MENYSNEKDILESFLYDYNELENLEDLLDEFNIFSALKLDDLEIRHSNFLAWLMNPKETHGITDYFLLHFLKIVSHKPISNINNFSIADLYDLNLADSEIIRESEDNIDICIKCTEQKFICVIENKIGAKEGIKQLVTYKDVINRRYPKFRKVFIYLTIKGDAPSDPQYIPISYKEIIPLIEHILLKRKDAISLEVLTFINHYLELLRRSIMKDSEIQKLCRSIYRKHGKAIELINESRKDVHKENHELFLEILKKEINLSIINEKSGVSIEFLPKSLEFIPGDEKGYHQKILLFQIINYGGSWSLLLCIGPGEKKELREKLYNIAKTNSENIFGVKQAQGNWSTIYKIEILDSNDYNDSSKIKDKFNEEINKFKENDLPKIENSFRKHAQELI